MYAKRTTVVIGAAMFLVMGLNASIGLADSVELYGSDHLNVSSSAPELIALYEQSSVDFLNGSLGNQCDAYDSSTVNVYDGDEIIANLYGYSIGNIYGGNPSTVRVYEFSSITITDGEIEYVRGDNNSEIDMSDGTVTDSTDLYADSTMTLSGGEMEYLSTYENSTFIMSDGAIHEDVCVYDTSTATITGGSLTRLGAFNSSIVTLYADDIILGIGLSWDTDGKTVLGTGEICGKWLGQTESWAIDIIDHDSTAIVMVITPEPATLALLAMGGLALLRRRRR